mmetsp:Transcript_16500/g.55697  ORF Transcript_16500/g.55697 Transcript_16500/m.55697 type:complete len:269 (-) Transcript_16500:21-827(-)
MLLLVVAHADKDVVQRLELRPRGTVARQRPLFAHGAERVEEKRVVALVVLAGDVGHGHHLEAFALDLDELVVRLVGMVLDELGEVVGGLLGDGVDADHVPIVKERHRLRHRAVHGARVAAKRLHDQKVVQLVVGFGVVGAHSRGLVRLAGAKRLAEVEHREVCEVRDSRDRLEDVEPGKVVVVVDHVDDALDRVDDHLVQAEEPLVEPRGHRPGRGRTEARIDGHRRLGARDRNARQARPRRRSLQARREAHRRGDQHEPHGANRGLP